MAAARQRQDRPREPLVDGGPEEPDELNAIFQRIASWLAQQSGIELLVEDGAFLQRRNLRGNPTTQGRLAYRGPNPQPTLPKLKLDITSNRRPGRRRHPRIAIRVLFVVNDHGELRSYRVNRIAAIRPTTTSFTPRFTVEF